MARSNAEVHFRPVRVRKLEELRCMNKEGEHQYENNDECRPGHAAILVEVAIYQRTYVNTSPGPAQLLTLSTISAIITPI